MESTNTPDFTKGISGRQTEGQGFFRRRILHNPIARLAMRVLVLARPNFRQNLVIFSVHSRCALLDPES